MFKRVTRQGTIISLKVSTPFTTDEVISSIQNTDILPPGYYVESATISEVKSVQIRRRIPVGHEAEIWTEIPERFNPLR